MPVKLTKLVDLEKYNNMSQSKQDSEKTCRGYSKSGLDWEADKNNPESKLEGKESLESTDLVETIENNENDNRQLKSYIMSIHKQAAELYNILDDNDDPEEWIIDKAKEASALINDVHGHISYAKKKVEELDLDVRDKVEEKGW